MLSLETKMGPCLAPWRALCIKADGSVVPDIQYRGSFGNIHTEPLRDILRHPALKELRTSHKRGAFASYCINCQKKEASGGRSRRTFFNDVLSEHIPALDFSIQEEPDIYFLELNTSNVCNLKCRMCSGLISTGWIRDEISLIEANVPVQRPRHGVFQLGHDGIDRLFYDSSIFKNLQFLAIRGGEPLYEETNLYLFHKLDQINLTPQIHLDISTNGTLLSQKILNALQKFKKVDIYVSLEGVGKAYQFIRGGEHYSFEQTENNIRILQQLSNVNLIFTFTAMVYNLGEMNPFWSWYNQIRRPGDEVSLSNIVTNPEYLNFQILPDDIKDFYHDEIDSGPIPKGPYNTGRRILGDVGIESILKGLKNKSYFSPERKRELQIEFKKFNTHLDKIRKMPIEEYIPELSLFYASIQT